MTHNKSSLLFKKACRLMPGGVNSPVRAFKNVDREPVFIEKGKGSRIYDVDGKEYIDYVCSWGPLILGHAHPEVVLAVQKAAKDGLSFGAATELEIQLAEKICNIFSALEMVRLVNSGTEAAMSAIRLARGFTKREKIIKFEGCYHGHGDSFLIKAGSGATTFGAPDSAGVTKGTAADTLTARFNDLDSVKKLIADNPQQIAAVIVEPVAANMGVVLPQENFLKGLREETADHQILLIFDEVITGFRLALGGAQEYYGITPDLTILGKILGGGTPIGAYGGARHIMEYISPAGPVYQAGTLSGNPLGMAAGLKTLELISEKGFYQELEEKGKYFFEGFSEIIKNYPLTQNWIASMSTLFFTTEEVKDYQSAISSDLKLFSHYFKILLDHGIYLAPSQFEATFLSTAHSYQDLDKTLEIAEKALKTVFQSR